MGGSVFQDSKSGHWFIQVRFNGKTERFYRYQYKESWFAFDSKGHARKVLSVMQDDIDNKSFNPAAYRPNSPLAIKQYVSEWLKLADVIKNTLKRYKSYSKVFVEYFGENKDIRKITKIDILQLKKWLEESGYSPKTTKHVLATLKTVLFFALDNRDITFMPSFPKLPNVIKANIDYLKKDLQDKVLQAIPERHRPIFELMAEYGLRIQEGRALMKDAVTDSHIIIMRRFSEYTLLEGDKVGKFRPYIKTARAKEMSRPAWARGLKLRQDNFYHARQGTARSRRRNNGYGNTGFTSIGQRLLPS